VSFFIGKNETMMDAAFGDVDDFMDKHPTIYGPRFEAIAELRKADDGTMHKGQEFRRVASFVNIPMFGAVTRLFEPDFMKDKNKFYAFLDRNKQYCTYDRRWQGGEQPKQGTPKIMNLADMGLAYEGAPETSEGWEPVEVEVPLASDIVREDA
jgi:hypothetical protein